MQFPPLSHGILVRRYKRFLADIQLPDGEQVTIHCPNTGAMTGCANAGDSVWFSTSSNPKRKYPYTWELTETAAGDLICVNTLRANHLVQEALEHQWIEQLAEYATIVPEQPYGEEKSRIDFLLKQENLPNCFVEVKSTTLLTQQGVGMFPDAKTERGQKHLRELTQIAQGGQRAVMLFAVLHTGITQFAVAQHIDPDYAKWYQQALDMGVQQLVYKVQVERIENVPVALRLTEQLS
ncbi:MAG: DNA/RNA nuclease SfsA [Pasteurellaceae bacterium]|nr:DNA/RNA nuclease SfsA [Pasteurellaceae bacterium]